MNLEELRKRVEELKKERDKVLTQISLLEDELKKVLKQLETEFGVKYSDLDAKIQSLEEEIKECLEKI